MQVCHCSLQKQQHSTVPRLISYALQQGLEKIWKHPKPGRIQEKQIAQLLWQTLLSKIVCKQDLCQLHREDLMQAILF